MNTVQYLSQIRRYEALIETKTMELAQIQAMATNITVAIDNERVQSSGDKDRIGRTVVKIIEKVEQLERIIEDFYEQRQTIISQIESLEKTEEYQILFMFFVGKKTISNIVEQTGYSFSSVKRIKNNGLVHFEEKYGSIYKDLTPIDFVVYEQDEP